MSKRSERLRALVTERLTVAAEEIFALVERTIAEYEEELCGFKEENQRKPQITTQALSPQAQLHKTGDDQQPFVHSPSLPETQQCKEEPLEGDATLLLTVKNEVERHVECQAEHQAEHEEPSLFQLRQRINSSDNDDDWESPANTLTAQMETEADGDHYIQIKDAHNSALTKYKSVPQLSTIGVGGKHECSFCQKRFATRQRLQVHTRIHTGEKPFSCTVCNEAFTNKGHLQTHMRTHTGEKPYSCVVCGRCFARQFTLQGHMRTHTGERPYCCTECGAAFAQRPHLTKHMSTHLTKHPEERNECVLCQRRFPDRALLFEHMAEHCSDELM